MILVKHIVDLNLVIYRRKMSLCPLTPLQVALNSNSPTATILLPTSAEDVPHVTLSLRIPEGELDYDHEIEIRILGA